MKKNTSVKNYTTADVDKSGTYTRLQIAEADFISAPLPWQRRGLCQTATGYGRKLATSRAIMFNGKPRRVYCCCFSNSGVCYITGGGNWGGHIIIED
jgi:hypothetical protein